MRRAPCSGERVPLPAHARAVLKAVAQDFDLGVGDLFLPTTRPIITRARREAFWRLWNMPSAPSKALIAAWFGMDHVTVLHALRRRNGDPSKKDNGRPQRPSREFIETGHRALLSEKSQIMFRMKVGGSHLFRDVRREFSIHDNIKAVRRRIPEARFTRRTTSLGVRVTRVA